MVSHQTSLFYFRAVCLRLLAAGLLLLLVLLAACQPKPTEPALPESEKPENFWTQVPGPPTIRFATSTGVLADGRVLVNGWTSKAATVAVTELFDPATGTWATLPDKAPGFAQGVTFLLKSGKLVLNDYTSQLIHAFNPATRQWHFVGQLGNTQGTYGTCELASGRVVVVGGATIGHWDQNASFTVVGMNSGTNALAWATVHQVPGTSRFIIFGNSWESGYGRLYEFNLPDLVRLNTLPLACLKTLSLPLPDGRLLLAGGANGRSVGNSPIPTTVFDPRDNSLKTVQQELKNAGGQAVLANHTCRTLRKAADGTIWFLDNNLVRSWYDAVSGLAVAVKNELDETKSIPTPKWKSSDAPGFYVESIILNDGRVLALASDTGEAWLSKK